MKPWEILATTQTLHIYIIYVYANDYLVIAIINYRPAPKENTSISTLIEVTDFQIHDKIYIANYHCWIVDISYDLKNPIYS